jgi:GT2 family glycosyltransferase
MPCFGSVRWDTGKGLRAPRILLKMGAKPIFEPGLRGDRQMASQPGFSFFSSSSAHEPPGRSSAAPSYGVAILHHRDEPALARCIASVSAQSLQPTATAVIDIDCDFREALAGLDVDRVERVAMPNRGYAGAANRALAWLRNDVPVDVEFALLITADVELEPGFAEALLSEAAVRGEVVIATGKLLRRDGVTLDSAGIRLPLHRRPRDRGSDEPDTGQFDEVEEVFGATGAALMLRVSVLADLEVEGEVFDEDFFMYHEDTDLSWRAGLLGHKVLYVPAARALHERGWKRNQRFEVPVALRRHSFKNHYLQWLKNERLGTLLLTLPIFLSWEIVRLGFAILKDPAVLPAYAQAARLVPRALRKRRILQSHARR